MAGMLRLILSLATAAVFIACSNAQMNSEAPDTSLFLPVVNVGSNNTGTVVPFYGCKDNGATLQSLGVWANDQWIRGLWATLTDGRQNIFGCLTVNGNQSGQTGCTGTGIRNSNFTFQSGERLVNLTLWPGSNGQGQANQRAGALSLTTTLGRSFDFGMTASRQNGVNIAVGGGVPCGVAPKAGADIDTLGFVFLRNVTANAIQDVQYSGVPATSKASVTSDVAPLDESAAMLEVGKTVYNNSGKTTGLVASSASQTNQAVSSQWTSSPGLDSYLLAPFNASVPQISDSSSSSSIRWQLTAQQLHARNESRQYVEGWNYTVNVGPGGVSQISASKVQGNITATYSGRLNVTVDSGASFSVPVSGQFQGLSTTPVIVKVAELAAAVTQSTSSGTGSSKGRSNTVPWVVGVLIGVLGGLILAALLAWAVVLIMRRRNKQAQDSNAPPPPKSWPFLPGVTIPAVFGKSKGSSEREVQKDVELGNKPGKGKWYVEDPTTTQSPVVGVPVNGTSKDKGAAPAHEGELPESEGQHVLPYNLFRRLRLDSIRRNLGIENVPENDASTPLSKSAVQLQNLEMGERLSNPASEASTPRTLPDLSGRDQKNSSSSEQGAESIDAISDPEAAGPSDGHVAEDDKIALIADVLEDEKELAPRSAAQKKQLREQVAKKLAQRQSTPEREQRPTTPASPPPAASSRSSAPSRKRPFFKKLSDSIVTYRGQAGPPIPHPSGLDKNQVQQPDSMPHADGAIKLGAGYKSAVDSRALEKNTVEHDDERLQLGVKYHTQGRNE